MKTLKIFLVLLFTVKAYSQNRITNDYKILIDSSIVIKSNNLLKSYKELSVKNVNIENDKALLNKSSQLNNDIYVIGEDYKSVVLNKIKSEIALKTLDIYDNKNKSLLKKGVYVWKIIPMLKGDVLTITILDARMTYKNKKYNFMNGGGSTIVFQYSCEEKKWVLIKEEHTGI